MSFLTCFDKLFRSHVSRITASEVLIQATSPINIAAKPSKNNLRFFLWELTFKLPYKVGFWRDLSYSFLRLLIGVGGLISLPVDHSG